MKTVPKLFNKIPYIFINNKLYIKNKNNSFIRIKQKLPEFINDIDDLKKYDIKHNN